MTTITQKLHRFETTTPNKCATILSIGIQVAINDAKEIGNSFTLKTIAGDSLTCPELVSKGKSATLLKTGTGLATSFHII